MVNKGTKILVGITQRIDSIVGRAELRDALDQRLAQWLVHSGFLPIVVPNILSGVNRHGEPML